MLTPLTNLFTEFLVCMLQVVDIVDVHCFLVVAAPNVHSFGGLSFNFVVIVFASAFQGVDTVDIHYFRLRQRWIEVCFQT